MDCVSWLVADSKKPTLKYCSIRPPKQSAFFVSKRAKLPGLRGRDRGIAIDEIEQRCDAQSEHQRASKTDLSRIADRLLSFPLSPRGIAKDP